MPRKAPDVDLIQSCEPDRSKAPRSDQQQMRDDVDIEPDVEPVPAVVREEAGRLPEDWSEPSSGSVSFVTVPDVFRDQPVPGNWFVENH